MPELPRPSSRVDELEAAIRETQARALLMAEMKLTELQRTTLANVLEPLSAVMADQPDHWIGGGR